MNTSISNEELESIAEEAYIFTFPMGMGYRFAYGTFLNPDSSSYRGAVNHGPYGHAVTLDSSYHDVISPNADTPYSFGTLDLRGGPVVLSVPEVTDRYYVMQFEDLFGMNEAYIGSRKTGNKAGNYVFVGPKWEGELPSGFDGAYKLETDLVMMPGRTQILSSEDKDACEAVMSQYKLQTIEEFHGGPAPVLPAYDWPVWNDEASRDERFIGIMNRLLPLCDPVHPEDADAFERFAKIGLGSGIPFDADSLDAEQRDAIRRGVSSARDKIAAAVPELGKTVNGWVMTDPFGNREFYKGDFLKRAAGAMLGWGGNDAVEAFYPSTHVDADGNKLDGNKKYQLTLDVPLPVNAFWSVTMYDTSYDGTAGYMVDNPIDRYLINSLTPGTVVEDGKLVVTMQRKEPTDPTERANWLPTPDGNFYLLLRLYWPKKGALDGTWEPSPVVKVG